MLAFAQALTAAMASWCDRARQRSRLRAVATRILRRGMAAAFVSWKEVQRQMAGARALLWRVVASRQRQCWDAWWHFATEVTLSLVCGPCESMASFAAAAACRYEEMQLARGRLLESISGRVGLQKGLVSVGL